MMLWSLIRGCSEPRSLERRRCKCSPDDLRDRFQRICSSDACAQPLSLFPITRIMRYSSNGASYLRRRRWAGFRVNARTAPSNACGYIRLVFACSCRNYRDSEAKRLLNAVTVMCLRTLWNDTLLGPQHVCRLHAEFKSSLYPFLDPGLVEVMRAHFQCAVLQAKSVSSFRLSNGIRRARSSAEPNRPSLSEILRELPQVVSSNPLRIPTAGFTSRMPSWLASTTRAK